MEGWRGWSGEGLLYRSGGPTVKRVDGKLRQPARMTQYSSFRGTEHFFLHTDRVKPTISDFEDGLFRRAMELSYGFCSHAQEFSDNFPSTFHT